MCPMSYVSNKKVSNEVGKGIYMSRFNRFDYQARRLKLIRVHFISRSSDFYKSVTHFQTRKGMPLCFFSAPIHGN